jgi:hypothetical protein
VSDQLTELLHRQTDDLPAFVRGASGLRRAAEAAQRKRRQAAAVTAVTTVTALVLGAAAVLTGSGADRAVPPSAVSPSPTVTTAGAGLLETKDLPTGVPFGAWTGTRDLANPSDGPFCVPEISTAGATAWQLRRFVSSVEGVDGYQAILEFDTLDDARHASATVTDLASCGPAPNNFELSADSRGGMAQNGRGVTDGGKVVSLAWSRSKQFVSVLELSWHSQVLLVQQVQDALWHAVRASLDAATEDVAPPAPSAGEQAMLAPEDITGLPSDAGKVTQETSDPYNYWPMHTCDYRVARDAPMRQELLASGGLGMVAAERLVVLDDAAAAQDAVPVLLAHVAACDDPMATSVGGSEASDKQPMEVAGGIGDEALGYTYQRTHTATGHDVVGVAVLRFGRVLVQVVRIQGGSAPTLDRAAFDELVRTAGDRLATHRDEVVAELERGG